MAGRDPHETGRAATPLELLFDLTFVVAFGIAASQFAHLLAEGHVAAGLAAFFFAMFAVCWAWINFTWFASAYDTDDWVYRLTTMLQMVGVLILGLVANILNLTSLVSPHLNGAFQGVIIVIAVLLQRRRTED